MVIAKEKSYTISFCKEKSSGEDPNSCSIANELNFSPRLQLGEKFYQPHPNPSPPGEGLRGGQVISVPF